MKTVGIICEYNPFHNGHARQFRLARALAGEDCAIVCLMSGNYVQRGEPAIFPKALRAEAALRCGADLVLELPLTAALSSAEGFAAGGVRILGALGCDYLCFGTETDDEQLIMSTARANLDPAFDALLRAELETGCSYPAARQRVLERLVEAQTPVGAELKESQMYVQIGPPFAAPAATMTRSSTPRPPPRPPSAPSWKTPAGTGNACPCTHRSKPVIPCKARNPSLHHPGKPPSHPAYRRSTKAPTSIPGEQGSGPPWPSSAPCPTPPLRLCPSAPRVSGPS